MCIIKKRRLELDRLSALYKKAYKARNKIKQNSSTFDKRYNLYSKIINNYQTQYRNECIELAKTNNLTGITPNINTL